MPWAPCVTNHGIVYAKQMLPCFPGEKIPITCAMSLLDGNAIMFLV